MRECVNLENVGQVEELLQMTEQMQDELDQNCLLYTSDAADE